MTSPFSYFGSMESPATSKAMVSSEIGNGSSTSPRPSGGTCSCSASIAAPAPTRQDFRRRTRTHAHRRRQTALGLARLLQSPLDQPDIQHGDSLGRISAIVQFRLSEIKPDFISEYPKLMI